MADEPPPVTSADAGFLIQDGPRPSGFFIRELHEPLAMVEPQLLGGVNHALFEPLGGGHGVQTELQ